MKIFNIIFLGILFAASGKKSKKTKDNSSTSTGNVAYDGDAFSLGDPTFFGSGCPSGTVEVVTSSDGDTLTVLFSDYIAVTDEDDNTSRLSCNLGVPIDVEPGFSVGIFKIEYRGYTYIPVDDGYTKFFAEVKINDNHNTLSSLIWISFQYFFAGIKGPQVEKRYEESGDVYIKDDIGAIIYSGCGAKTILRINTSIMAYKPDEDDEDVEIGIDSTDVTVDQEFRYYLTKSTC